MTKSIVVIHMPAHVDQRPVATTAVAANEDRRQGTASSPASRRARPNSRACLKGTARRS